MKRAAGWGVALGSVLLGLGLTTAARADEPFAGAPGKGLLSWQPLTTDELANARAGAVANNTLTQSVTNDLDADTVTGGAMTFATGAITHNSLTVSIFNTGNNVVLQAGAAFIVNLTP